MKERQTNPELLATIRFLRKTSNTNQAAVWGELALDLKRSKQARPTVNISRIVRSIKEGETAVVPGKVLGMGAPRKITVAAFSFTEEARKKIESAGGECLSFRALVERNPEGSGVRIIG